MGRRDFAKAEKKKPRKDAKKATISNVVQEPRPEVEVIRRGKKPKEGEEE